MSTVITDNYFYGTVSVMYPGTYNPIYTPNNDIRESNWECRYCDSINPSTSYKCGHCGAPRKKNNSRNWKFI